MLQQRHVELLLIAEGARFTAGVCPLCGWVSTNRRSCNLGGTGLASVDGYAQAVELAEEQAARIMVVRHELDAMTEHGSIATLPRADARYAVLAPSIPPSPARARAGRCEHDPGVLRPLRESLA